VLVRQKALAVRIYKHEPFAEDRNFGAECNHYLAMAPAGSWVAILDHDIFWGTGRYHELMCEAIAARPDAGAFAVVTNRCASPWQRSPGAPSTDNIHEHRRHGELCRTSRRTLTDITDTKGFGGVVTLVNRDAWAETEGYADGLFCIDHSLFFRMRDKGRRIYLMDGLYVYHLRETSGAPGRQEPKWKDCPCRGREEMPTERIALL